MAEFIIQSENLESDVLTHKMPLSDAFHSANAGLNKPGVQWGYQLDYKDRTSLKVTNTDYLRIEPGKALIAVNGVSGNKAENKVLVTVSLEDSLDINITAYTPSAIYFVYLFVEYTAASLSPSSGLVLNPGTNSARIVISDTELVDDNMMTNLLLGKFSISAQYVESLTQLVKDESGMDLVNGTGALYEFEKDAFVAVPPFFNQVEKFKSLVCYNNVTNLRKHVRFKGLTDVDGINAADKILFQTATTFVFSNNWEVNYGAAIASKGIWNDVEVMEFDNCVFTDDVILAIHRTPGNNAFYASASGTEIEDNRTDLTGYVDHGARRLVIDGGKSGLIVNGDLTVSAILDFVGHIYDFVFDIELKNIRVKGDLTLIIGSSRPFYRCGKFGKIKYENVLVQGLSKLEFAPRGDVAGAVRCTAWDENIGPFDGSTTDSFGGVHHGGPTYAPVEQPPHFEDSLGTSEGILILYNQFNDAAGTDFVYSKEHGALEFVNSTIPLSLFSDSFDYDKTAAVSNYFDKRRLITVKMLGCERVNTWEDISTEARIDTFKKQAVLTNLYTMLALDHKNTADWADTDAEYLAVLKERIGQDRSLAYNFTLGGFSKRVLTITLGSVTVTLVNSVYLWELRFTSTATGSVQWLVDNLRQSKLRNTIGPAAITTRDKADWVWFGATTGAMTPWELFEVTQHSSSEVSLTVIGDISTPPALNFLDVGSFEEFGDAVVHTAPDSQVRNVYVQNNLYADGVYVSDIQGLPGQAIQPNFPGGLKFSGRITSVAGGGIDIVSGATLSVLAGGIIYIHASGQIAIGSTVVAGGTFEKLIDGSNADSLHKHSTRILTVSTSDLTLISGTLFKYTINADLYDTVILRIDDPTTVDKFYLNIDGGYVGQQLRVINKSVAGTGTKIASFNSAGKAAGGNNMFIDILPYGMVNLRKVYDTLQVGDTNLLFPEEGTSRYQWIFESSNQQLRESGFEDYNYVQLRIF